MPWLRSVLIRGTALGLCAAVFLAGALVAYVAWYTESGRILPGVQVGRIQAGGLEGEDLVLQLRGAQPWSPTVAPDAGAAAPAGWPAPVLELRALGRTWLLDRSAVGPEPDAHGAAVAAAAIGRQGTALARTRAYLGGLVHGYYVPVQSLLREDLVRERLEAIGREIAAAPVDAAYNFATDTLIPDTAGQELDLEASLDAVRRAVRLEQPAADLVVRPIPASVQAADLTNVRQHQIARFTTPILVDDPGRVHNITMAVNKISGTLLNPGEIFSFNGVVGPRDEKHGWAPAQEVYQGEFVLGYGGGICQVSSTLYNSVLLAGLEVKERYHHDRPLEYVPPGRDATVVYGLLDFRFRNSLSVPILVGASVVSGKPQQIEVTLHAPEPLPNGPIGIEEADVRYLPPKMTEVFDKTLPEGERRVVDEGYYGIDVKIYRVFGEGARQRRELVSHDQYKPKLGKVRVGVGNRPGSQKLADPGLQ